MNKRLLSILVLLLILFTSCSKDDSSSTYSKKNYVYCYFYVPTYTHLFNAMGSYGEFVTIRQRTYEGATVVEMVNSVGTGRYAVDKTMSYFSYGLGGLIVGTNYYGEYLAYDLACPNCDRADRRLSVGDAGIVKCNKCGLSYDLNNYGVISAASTVSEYESPRGLYRYRIMYDGTNLSVYN